MRRRLACGMALVGSLLWYAGTLAAEEATVPAGRRVYEREGCAMCHSIAGQGRRRHPLDGVGSRLGKEDLRKWIVSPQEMKPDVEKKSYRLPPEDLDALLEYLGSLR